MRKITVFIGILACIIIASCGDKGDISPPGATDLSKRKLIEFEFKAVNEGFADSIFWKMLVIEDIEQQTITFWADSAKDSYHRFFYDEGGRLQKMIINKPPYNPEATLSLVIDRVGVGVFDLIHTYIPKRRYTVTPLPDGSRQVMFTAETSQQPYISKTIIDKDGLLLTDTVPPPYSKYRKFYYDLDKRLSENKDTMRAGTEIEAKTISFTKNSMSNTYLLSFLKKLVGPDLDWMLYDDALLTLPIWFGGYVSPFMYLQNGTITSNSITLSKSNDGVNFVSSQPSHEISYQTTYDGKGRISQHYYVYKVAPGAKWQTSFKYFD